MLLAILHFVLHPTATPGCDAGGGKKLAGALFEGLFWFCFLKNWLLLCRYEDGCLGRRRGCLHAGSKLFARCWEAAWKAEAEMEPGPLQWHWPLSAPPALKLFLG